MTETKAHGVRIEAGASLPAAVEEEAANCSLRFCDVSGFGELRWVDLAGPYEGTTIHLEGPLQLLDLKGRLRLAGDVVIGDFVCTLARHTDNGIQVLGGKLARAESQFVELSFVPLTHTRDGVPAAPNETDKAAVPRLIADSSLPLPPASLPDTGGSATASDNRWNKAIAESNRVLHQTAERGEDFDAPEVPPKTGDIVNHRQFGECTVVRLGDDHITLRKPDRRNVQLGLPILRFFREGEEDGHTVFRVEIKPRR